MANQARVRGFVAVALVVSGGIASAQAPTSWTRGADTFGTWTGLGSWNLSAGPEPTATTEVLVGVNTFAASAQMLAGTGVGSVSGSAAGILFTNTTAKYLRGQPGNNTNANSHRLRVASSGITVSSTSGATGNVRLGVFVGNPTTWTPGSPVGTFTFDINDAQTFKNDSASILQFGQSNATENVFIRPGVDSVAGTHALTFSGTGTGTFDIYAIVQDQPSDATRIRSLVVNRADAAAGAVRLYANNTYTGPTSITAGTLLVNGTTAGSGGTTVTSGGILGGVGSLGGAITFDSGSRFLFNASTPLTVAGSVSFTDPGSFGVDDIVGLDSSVNLGTYTLMAGTVNTAGLANVGVANAASLGAGKWAYFQQGSLQVVVSAVPEPAAVGLLGATGLVVMATVGRRLRRPRGRG